MKIGEIWIDKEDGVRVRIIELNIGGNHEDEVLFEYLDGLPATNYCTRKEFLEAYRKKY